MGVMVFHITAAKLFVEKLGQAKTEKTVGSRSIPLA